jgi:ribosomal protein L20A (L18A)
MPTFKILASEVVYYQEEVEAKNEDDAIEKMYELYPDLKSCNTSEFSIDKIIEGDHDE